MTPAHQTRRLVPIQAALLALVALALLTGVLPAGLLLDRWLARELESRVRGDLAMAPALLTQRNAAIGDAMMMHAKDIAHEPGLADALGRGDVDSAERLAERAARSFSYGAVVVNAKGVALEGPALPARMIAATRRGEMPVSVISDGDRLYMLSVAPVQLASQWIGAAGVAAPLDEAAAAALAALTRSDRVIFLQGHATVSASPGDSATVLSIAAQALARLQAGGETEIAQIHTEGRTFLVAAAPLGNARVLFVRDLGLALALLPRLRLMLAATAAGALILALLLGSVLGTLIAGPARALASAADRLSRGDFAAPLEGSRIRELARVTGSFAEMRAGLEQHIAELRAANRALEDRQARLTSLQAELIRRERAAVSARMVAELAHEIRNPIANVRNCLELIQRRARIDPESEEFASLAIDELLRMHEMAERMLDLHRPRDPSVSSCDASAVAREVATLARLGLGAADAEIALTGSDAATAAVAADALKQVLLTLVQNAREAVPRGLRLTLDVRQDGANVVLVVSDNGPGVPPPLRERVFEPFFTTRSAAGGVGLGLSVVEATLRACGGSIAVEDAPSGGASFRIVIPSAEPTAVPPPAARQEVNA